VSLRKPRPRPLESLKALPDPLIADVRALCKPGDSRLAALANALADLVERSQAREAKWLEAVAKRDREIAKLREELYALRRLARDAVHGLTSTAREPPRETD
jgi:hypothetical protein